LSKNLSYSSTRPSTAQNNYNLEHPLNKAPILNKAPVLLKKSQSQYHIRKYTSKSSDLSHDEMKEIISLNTFMKPIEKHMDPNEYLKYHE